MPRLPHEFPGLPSTLYRPLDAGAVKAVADAAFDVLARSGMSVYSPAAFEAFESAGAEVDAGTRNVRLPRSLIEDAIDSNPSSITLYSRDGEFDCVLEDSKVHYGTGGTAIYVLDPDSGERRPSTVDDVILNARLIEQLEHVHLFTINVFPNEIENTDDIDVNRFFHALDNTRKHVMGGIYSEKGCREAIELSQMAAGGADALRDRPIVSFITLIISPFKIDETYGQITCDLARRGLPVVVPTEPICGTTAPMTLAGNLLTHVAETLGGIAMVQCVNKGAPGICGSVGSITNLRTMDHLGGPIERAMINAAVAQMAQHFKLPLYSTGGTTDSKAVDVQAAIESAMSSLLVAMSGANYIHDIAGLMEMDLTVSYDKLVIDNEILGMCQRVLRGIEVNDQTLATELMIEKGPGEDFLAEEHSIDFMFDEFFVPKLANREKRELMEAEASVSDRAHAFVNQVRQEPIEPCLSDEVRQQMFDRFPTIRQSSPPGG